MLIVEYATKRHTQAKMEVATKEESNPIAQDIKKGKLRDYHGPIFWNYGTFLDVVSKPRRRKLRSFCLSRCVFFFGGIAFGPRSEALRVVRMSSSSALLLGTILTPFFFSTISCTRDFVFRLPPPDLGGPDRRTSRTQVLR
jgi:hypothetical protein